MSKELPYFKFYVNEWITGDITLEDYAAQGLFTNICAYYWSKECKVTFTNIKKKFKDADSELFNSLLASKIIKVDKDDNLLINFLLEQKIEYDLMCKRNLINGQKGGRPIKENNPLKTQSVKSGEPTQNPNVTNIEEKRRDKKREDDEPATSINFCRSEYEKNYSGAIQTIMVDKNLNPTTFKIVIDYFDIHLKSTGVESKTIIDYAKHFANWLKKIDYKKIINDYHANGLQKKPQPSLAKYK